MFYGLLLDLYVDTDSDYNEFKVHIHNQTKTPVSLFNSGYILSAGCYNYFQVERVFEKRLGEPWYPCLKRDDIHHSHFNKTIIDFITKTRQQEYTQEECYELCMNLHYDESRACNCSLNRLDEVLSNKCSRKLSKVDEDTKDCTDQFIREFTPPSNCEKYCPLECDSENIELIYPRIKHSRN